MNTSHFIHSTTDGHLVAFHFGAIKNNAALHIFIHVLWCTDAHMSVGNILGMEFLGYKVYMC